MFRVKICGLVNRADALAAVASGADAVGCLVGVRHRAEDSVTPEAACSILAGLPRSVQKVVVTHMGRADAIFPLLHRINCSCLQLHDRISVEEICALKDGFPDVLILKALSVGARVSVEERERLREEALSYITCVDGFVLDSSDKEKDRIGGTGQPHDWAASEALVPILGKPVILAGGLVPENVIRAIEAVLPYGVDVNTGVEASCDRGTGRKDETRLRLFIQNARRALDRIHGCPP
ncbi:MAG: phosphoribosylanthranilate isomerase [Candidatus Aminicenantes bacterium]|nr:phosphoribosylanthranilate isomerase [Candidatus Aminicenantes bacterium]